MLLNEQNQLDIKCFLLEMKIHKSINLINKIKVLKFFLKKQIF